MLYRLIYVSRLSDGVDLKETRRILAASQANNPSRAITGALVFNSGYFLQWIEGSRREISALFARLTTDPRHFAPEILDFSSVARREFGEWSMGYVGEGVLNQELFSRYSHSTSFDPYQLDGPSAVEFMREAAAVSLRMGRSPRVGAETAA